MIKKGYILFITLAVVIMASVHANANSSERIVEDLICKRIDTLNMYYTGQIEALETKEIIEDITAGFLRDADINNIDTYFQTEIEPIKRYDITKIDITKEDETMICAYVTIEWEAESLKGEDNFTHIYSVICENEKKSYKLLQFF